MQGYRHVIRPQVGGPAEEAPEDLKLYSPKQVARILQVTEQSVRVLVKQGRLEAFRVGIQLRIRKEALNELLLANRWSGPDPRRQKGGRRRWGRQAEPGAGERPPGGS